MGIGKIFKKLVKGDCESVFSTGVMHVLEICVGSMRSSPEDIIKW